MKIVFVAHGASNGGAGRVSSILCNELSKLGHTIYYMAFYYQNIDYRIEKNVNYYIIPQKYSNKLLKNIYLNKILWKYIKQIQPDIVISFATNIMLYTGFLWNGPIIYSLRNDPNSVNADIIGRNLRNILYNKAKAVVFQTPGAKKYFSQSIQRKGVIIGNPIQEGLPEWKKEKCEKIIITVCRLDKQKNVSMLLKAFSIFYIKHPDYFLYICGDGPLKNVLIQESVQLGISDRTKFLGFCNNATELVAKSNVFVLSSDYEGLSNSMLEALAIGIPTVCTDCPSGGAACYIEDGVNGFLVPIGNEICLANALSNIIDNDNIQKQLSIESKKINNYLSKNNVVLQWEKLLLDVIDGEF